MHDIAGLVALAIIGLWIAYLVPHRLRYRQQLLESRTEDRFSEALRVLAVADPGRDARAGQARAECGPDSPKRSGLLSPARGVPVGGRPAVTKERGGAVERPYGTQETITADDARRAAQLRAKRAATLARRAAAARRRAALTGVLAGASVLAWVLVGLTPVGIGAALVPTALLVGVLGLGRRAAVVARRADAAWERRQEAAATRPAGPRVRVTGRAQHPSDNHTEVIALVGARTAEHPTVADGAGDVASRDAAADEDGDHAPARAEVESADDVADVAGRSGAVQAPVGSPSQPPSDQWSPVPVPRPTYTTKATAPRREPAPLVVDADPAAQTVAVPASAGERASGSDAPTLDLDAILARRRAAGE